MLSLHLNLIGITLFKKLCLSIKNKDLTKITQDIEEYILIFGVYLIYFLQIFLFLQNSQKKINFLRK
jgi:hypothetical protein